MVTFVTAPMGGFALGTDGSTSTGTSTNILQAHPASGSFAVNAGTPTAGSTKGAVGTGSLTFTGNFTASGIFHASTDAPSTTVFTVTVATGTNVYGSGNKYFINGSIATPLTLYEGNTYRFDQSNSSNSNHPLRFSETANGGGSEYTTNVTTAGTPGSSGSYTEITVPDGGPPLHFYCSNHSGMGNFADTPTTITAVITATGVASRIAVSGTATGAVSVTGSATATSVEVVLLVDANITATGVSSATRVAGVTGATGNNLAITDSVHATAVLGIVGSGTTAATATSTASRVLGMFGSGTISATGTVLVLPDPNNYAAKDVLTSTASASSSFTVHSTTPVRYQYALVTGDIAATGTGTPTAVYSAQATGTAAINALGLHNAGQKYLLGSGSVTVTVTSPQILIVVRAFPDTTTITASATSSPYVRLRQRVGIADAPVFAGTGAALRNRLVNGTAVAASTATGAAHAHMSVQGIGATAATATATAVKIRIMSPASASIAATGTGAVNRLRKYNGAAVGAATATADGIVVTLKLMQAASAVAMTEVANVQRILPKVGAAAIAADGTIDVKAIFSLIVDGKITCGSFAQIFRSVTNERTDAIVQRYSRRVLPTGELRDVLGNEFQNIERTMSSVTEATILLTDVEPGTKRRGMVRYAVTPWDPLSNGTTGLVVYDGNAWSAV